MDEFKDKDIEVEPGKVQTIPSNNLTWIYCRLLSWICGCYDSSSKLLSVLMNNNNQVFNDSSTYCGTLKALAFTIVATSTN